MYSDVGKNSVLKSISYFSLSERDVILMMQTRPAKESAALLKSL